MFRRSKPDTLALLAALIGSLLVLSVVIVDLTVSRQDELLEGEERLRHFTQMVAEHSARSLEAVDVLLAEMSADLGKNQSAWQDWSANRGWEYVAQRHSRALPQLRDLILFDEVGNQRFISTYFPTPRINVRDRPYFSALSAPGGDFASFGPYVGRNSGRYTYGLGRSIRLEDGRFAGIAYAALELAYFQEFCWTNRLSDDFDSFMVNAEGAIISSCRPADLGRQSGVIGGSMRSLLGAGRVGDLIPDAGQARGRGYLISVSPVGNFRDLRIVAAIPEASVLGAWQKRLLEFGLLSAVLVTVLLFGGWLVWRRTREIRETAALLESHQIELEQRVEEATGEIARQKNAAERANTAKSRFLAAASHDLRQPLHALSLFVNDLQRQVKRGNHVELPRLADQIATSCTVLSELLDSLLDISRLDVVGIKTDVRIFPLQQVLTRLDASFRRQAQAKGLHLILRPSTFQVRSDPALIERLLANLVSNAIRYTPTGGRVLLACRRRGEQVLVEVRDNGIGIPEEHQAAIFGEFYQVGNAEREHRKGLGLGLSIVQRLAKALDVPVGLRSQPGRGTTFHIHLPLCPDFLAETAPVVWPEQSLLLLGRHPDVAEAARLCADWGWSAQRITQVDSLIPEALRNRILIADEAISRQIQPRLHGSVQLISLVSEAQNGFEYALHLPLRPAKLRALLDQLQKALSKSNP